MMLLYNIVEENGKTIKENNLARNHNIATGTLVETEEGLRLYVSYCGRDCDGTPLYWLSFEETIDQSSIYERGKQTGGYSEETLKIVRRRKREDRTVS